MKPYLLTAACLVSWAFVLTQVTIMFVTDSVPPRPLAAVLLGLGAIGVCNYLKRDGHE